MKLWGIAYGLVVVLVAVWPALANVPCPPKTIFTPMPEADEVTFATADLSTAGVPLAWQRGRLGTSHYRLFPNGSGSIGEDEKMSGWRVDFICDGSNKTCQYVGVQNPPASATQAAKKIGACLLFRPLALATKAGVTSVAKPTAGVPSKVGASQSGLPAAEGPKPAVNQPAKIAAVASPSNITASSTIAPPRGNNTPHSLPDIARAPTDATHVTPAVLLPFATTSAPNPAQPPADKVPLAELRVLPEIPIKTAQAAVKPALTGTPKSTVLKAPLPPMNGTPAAQIAENLLTPAPKLALIIKYPGANQTSNAAPSAPPPFATVQSPNDSKLAQNGTTTATSVLILPQIAAITGSPKPLSGVARTTAGPSATVEIYETSSGNVPVGQQPPQTTASIVSAAVNAPPLTKPEGQIGSAYFSLAWPHSNVCIAATFPVYQLPGPAKTACRGAEKTECWVTHLPSESPFAIVQRLLLLSGYDAGPIDGTNGTRTRKALLAALGAIAPLLSQDQIIVQLKANLCADGQHPPQ